MLRLTKNDIRSGMTAIKRCAKHAYHQGDDIMAMHYMDIFANIGGQFNLEYCDNDMETLLSEIAARNINTLSTINFVPDANRWVLYDDFCTTYVLGLQWLDAMAKSGKEILYITTRDIDAKNRNRTIIPDIEQYANVRVEIVPNGNRFTRAQYIYDSIIRFGASKLVMHKFASVPPIQLVLPILPKGVERYVINLSDQTFWLGARYIDYCLEFRQFGANVSLQRRGLKRDQLLMVPFYPADDLNPFAGYPEECTEDKVIIFSGGDYYKTLDANHTYWNLVKNILNDHPEVVFLYATKNIPEGDSEIVRFIHDNHFEHRFIYINFRPDIYQVFAHCDIYMGTCPTSGSLMSQLAAINAKPILQYYKNGTPDDETEQAICWNKKFQISFADETDFFQEVNRLISDISYRKQQGERLQKAMIHQEQFVDMVNKTLETNTTQWSILDAEINYEELDDRWFYLEEGGYTNSLSYLYGSLGANNCIKYALNLFLKKKINNFIGRIIR